jgi:hypothetical protein
MGLGGQRHVRPLYPQKRDPVPIVQETGGGEGGGPVWNNTENLAPPALPESKHRTVQPVASRYTNYAFPAALNLAVLIVTAAF